MQLACAWLLLVSGCGASLEMRSARASGCRERVRVENVRGTKKTQLWTAWCGSARYECMERANTLECAHVEDAALRNPPARPRVAPGYVASGAPRRSVVQRGYDEERHAHFVTGRFDLDRGLSAVISGAPAVSLGTIVVTLQGRAPNDAVRQCNAVEVLVHGEPVATEHNASDVGADRLRIESRFEFRVFQPLADRFPVFGVRACGTTWAFTPEQLEQLRALLAVYSDIAKKVQEEGQQPTPEPGQTAL